MPFQCIGKSPVIQKPSSGIVFDITGTTTPPFELKGEPFSNAPEPLRNAVQLVRKLTAVIDTARDDYTADKNYYQVKVNAPNIIGRNENTTLRYDEDTYTQEFIAVHRNIWYTVSNSLPQVSIVLTNSRGHIFHICIPIILRNSNDNENEFLKYWLYPNPSGKMEPGMTVNELLNFREQENERVNFQTLDYCLEVNDSIRETRYILCLFEKGLSVNSDDLPEWFKNDTSLSDLTSQNIPSEERASSINTFIMKKRFDDILSFMFRGTFYQSAIDIKLTRQILYFDDRRTQSVVIPAYYTVTSRQIAGSMVKTKLKTGKNKRALNNIKCYPIDLVNQVDNDGNIVIDETTNKPVDVKSVTDVEQGSTLDPNAALELERQQKENQQKVMFWIIFAIAFAITLSIVVALLVYFVKGKSYSPAMSATSSSG